jgi:hypothetical protein
MQCIKNRLPKWRVATEILSAEVKGKRSRIQLKKEGRANESRRLQTGTIGFFFSRRMLITGRTLKRETKAKVETVEAKKDTNGSRYLHSTTKSRNKAAKLRKRSKKSNLQRMQQPGNLEKEQKFSEISDHRQASQTGAQAATRKSRKGTRNPT